MGSADLLRCDHPSRGIPKRGWRGRYRRGPSPSILVSLSARWDLRVALRYRLRDRGKSTTPGQQSGLRQRHGMWAPARAVIGPDEAVWRLRRPTSRGPWVEDALDAAMR